MLEETARESPGATTGNTFKITSVRNTFQNVLQVEGSIQPISSLIFMVDLIRPFYLKPRPHI